MMKRAIITGNCGFAGSAVAVKLERGVGVIGWMLTINPATRLITYGQNLWSYNFCRRAFLSSCLPLLYIRNEN
jgi:hypothetical protein